MLIGKIWIWNKNKKKEDNYDSETSSEWQTKKLIQLVNRGALALCFKNKRN
jgi:hypothetical protein